MMAYLSAAQVGSLQEPSGKLVQTFCSVVEVIEHLEDVVLAEDIFYSTDCVLWWRSKILRIS